MRSLKSKLNLRISLTTQAFHKVKNNYVGLAQFLPLFQVWFIFTKHLAIEPTNMLHERKSFKIQARDVHAPYPTSKKLISLDLLHL